MTSENRDVRQWSLGSEQRQARPTDRPALQRQLGDAQVQLLARAPSPRRSASTVSRRSTPSRTRLARVCHVTTASGSPSCTSALCRQRRCRARWHCRLRTTEGRRTISPNTACSRPRVQSGGVVIVGSAGRRSLGGIESFDARCDLPADGFDACAVSASRSVRHRWTRHRAADAESASSCSSSVAPVVEAGVGGERPATRPAPRPRREVPRPPCRRGPSSSATSMPLPLVRFGEVHLAAIDAASAGDQRLGRPHDLGELAVADVAGRPVGAALGADAQRRVGRQRGE